MKALIHSYVCWPGIDGEVELCVKASSACQASKNLPAKAPLHPWAWPTEPWERVHVDFAGPIQGMMLLLVVDAHSKWPEACIMSSTTSGRTITEPRRMFVRWECHIKTTGSSLHQRNSNHL